MIAELIGLGFWTVCVLCAHASVGIPQLVSRGRPSRIVGPQWDSRQLPRSGPAHRMRGSRENAAELVERLAPEYDPADGIEDTSFGLGCHIYQK